MTYSIILSENMEKHKAGFEVSLQWFEKNYNLLLSDQVKIKKDDKDKIIKEWETIQGGLKQSISAMKTIKFLCDRINIEKENKGGAV